MEFQLLYYIKGMTPDYLRSLHRKKFDWYAERLLKQLKDEAEAMKPKKKGKK